MRKSNSTSNIDFNNDFQEKEQNKNVFYDNSISLLKHKVFLEKLLHLIKISQIDYLSQISSNSNKSNVNTNNDTDIDTNTNNNNNDNPKNKIRIIKSILSNLQKDLITTLKDNTDSKAKMQNETTNIKSSLIKSIFEASGHPESSNLDTTTLNDTPKSIQKKNVSNYNESYYKYNIELPHLKLLNFKIVNQLNYINSLIKVKMQSIKHLYIFCDNQNDISDASNHLHQNLINARNDFKSMVKKKEVQNRNLLILDSQINSMREEVATLGKKSSNEYINTSEVINEDSMEYYTKTNVCTMENYKRNSKDFENENKINNIGFNNKVLIPKNKLFE